MDRQIVCFAIPTFQVALARLANPELQSWPVAIALSVTPRSLLAEVSVEAEQDGVCAGMSVLHAQRCCPSLTVLPSQPARLREADQALFQVVRQFAPVWEPIQPGQMFLDLTGTRRLFGLACDTAARIEREVSQRHGLVGVAGVASSKLVSRIASTLVMPSTLCDVRPGSEDAFLAPLPVETLPLPVSYAKTVFQLFDDLNLRTLGALTDIPLAALESVLGRHAKIVQAWAHGVDSSPVLPPVQQVRVEATRHLDPDVIDTDQLRGVLYGVLEQVCSELRQQQRVCHQLVLLLQYRDAVEVEQAQSVSPGNYWEVDLAPWLFQLFARCFRRRVRVRMLRVTVVDPTSPDEQLSLFASDAECDLMASTRAHRLTRALDQIRSRFGTQAIWLGKTHAAVRSSPRPF
jgi:DNA polymerase-4